MLASLGCGFEPQEERANAVESANIALGRKDCDAAIEVLNSAPFSWDDATFLRTLSLSHACKGKFDVFQLFQDIPNIFGSVSDSPLGGLSIFTASFDMESPEDNDYVNVQTALNYLLYAGGIPTDEDPTPEKRDASFIRDDVAEIEMLSLYQILTNLGRFLNYYGNVGTDGVKGNGGQANKCFLVYDDLPLQGTLIKLRDFFDIGLTGGCSKARAADSGHQYLYDANLGTRNISRLCEGAVLVNNFFTLLPRVLESISGSEFNDINAIKTLLTLQLTLAEGYKPGLKDRVGDVLSKELCVLKNANDDTFLQFYYAIVLEVLLK